jgi:hypothetical protein
MEKGFDIAWRGVEQFSQFLQSGSVSFLAVIILMVLIGALR